MLVLPMGARRPEGSQPSSSILLMIARNVMVASAFDRIGA